MGRRSNKEISRLNEKAVRLYDAGGITKKDAAEKAGIQYSVFHRFLNARAKQVSRARKTTKKVYRQPIGRLVELPEAAPASKVMCLIGTPAEVIAAVRAFA